MQAWRKINKGWAIALGVVFVAGASLGLYLWHISNSPVNYEDIREHYKYGSIGSEPTSGIPYWIWKVLPEMFPENYLGKAMHRSAFWWSRAKILRSGFRSEPFTSTW